MKIALIIFIILSLAGFALAFYYRFMSNNNKPIIVNPGDEEKAIFLVNSFIRKEFLFELSKWLIDTGDTINVDSGANAFIDDIKSPEKLQKRVAIITSLIVSRMSDVI